MLLEKSVLDILDDKVVAAILSALFGGAGLKIIEKILGKRAQEFTEAASIREELRQQISLLQTEMDSLRSENEQWRNEADSWREKYWAQMEINITQESKMNVLQRDFNEMKHKLQSLTTGSL